MKILLGCSSPPDTAYDGIATYTREVAESLISLGHDVHIAAPSSDDLSWFKINNIYYIETDQYDDPCASSKRLYEYINKQGIEAIINNDNPYLQNVIPALQCPCIVIGHLGEMVIASLACNASKYTDYVVAISNDMYSTFIRKHKVPIYKCPVILNGISDNNFDAIDLNENKEFINVIYAGGSNKRKGYNEILQSIRLYKSRWNGIKLHLFGNLPDAVLNEIKSLDYVVYYGVVKRDDFIKHLRAADVLLFPSRSEGCPMVMLEAMRFSVISITSDGVGAMDSLVTSGRDGYICHLDHWAEQATECLVFLRQNNKILNRMKINARKRFLADFQSHRVAKSLIELIEHPTVDRRNLHKQIDVFKWHRPVPKGRKKGTLLNRIRYRFGIIQKAGRVGLD